MIWRGERMVELILKISGEKMHPTWGLRWTSRSFRLFPGSMWWVGEGWVLREVSAWHDPVEVVEGLAWWPKSRKQPSSSLPVGNYFKWIMIDVIFYARRYFSAGYLRFNLVCMCTLLQKTTSTLSTGSLTKKKCIGKCRDLSHGFLITTFLKAYSEKLSMI